MPSLTMIRSRSSSLLLPAVLLLIVSPLSILASCHSRPSTSDRSPSSYSSTNDDLPSQQDIEEYGLISQGPQGNRGGGGNKADRLDGTTRTGSDVEKGWVDPNLAGGSMLDLVNNGLREPINLILSSLSDPYILSDSGLRDYVRSIGFSFECLDLHIGDLQRANLGDGGGWREEMFEYRSTEGFRGPGRWVGACWESWSGGNHFRVWKQNGSEANTGAWFLAVSEEKNLRHKHTINVDGYNAGRDALVSAAIRGGQFGDRIWKADVEWVQGLLPRGRDGINHDIEIDGMTAVLTVQRYWTIPPAELSTRPTHAFSFGLSLPARLYDVVASTVDRAVQWLAW